MDLELIDIDEAVLVGMQNGHARAKAASHKVSEWTNDEAGVGKELNLLLALGL